MARAPLLLAVAALVPLLAGCTADEDEALPSSPATSASPVPLPSPSSAAPAQAELTLETAWEACEDAWEEQEPGLDWAGWDPFDPEQGSANDDGTFYVVRYRMEDDAAVDARNCVVSGTGDDLEVQTNPPLDNS